MQSRVSRALGEWTHGLDARQSLIAVFTHIRDIPYSLVVPMNNLETAPEQILALKKGYCGPKHYLLAEMYRRLGYEVVFTTFPFLWNDPDLQYPPELRKLATTLPVAYHLACRVRVNDRWVLVDATWDRPLKRAGFPVNEQWDGQADTLCAVKPLQSDMRTAFCRTVTNGPSCNRGEQELNPHEGEQDRMDTEDHARYYREKTGIRTPEEHDRIRRFYREFDAWLVKVRG
jgi:hypothetical protein